jgi:hypothetical protein
MMAHMRAVAAFPGSQQVKIIEQEPPAISRPDQVTLRLLEVGICGTDKEICSFEYGTAPPGSDHLVIGLQDFIKADPARLMRTMVLKNQVLLGTVNAGPEDFAAALRDLDVFRRRWPAVAGTLIAGRHPPEQAPELILGRPAGIKTVITFE